MKNITLCALLGLSTFVSGQYSEHSPEAFNTNFDDSHSTPYEAIETNKTTSVAADATSPVIADTAYATDALSPSVSSDAATTTSTAYGNNQTVAYIPPTFDVSIPIPVFIQPKTDTELIIQNGGFGLYANKSADSYQVEVNAVTSCSQQQTWFYRSNGHIVQRESDLCLYRQADSKIGLVNCQDEQVCAWDIDFQEGIYTERESKQVLFMQDNTVITKPVQGDMSGCSWSTYKMVSREEYKAPTIIEEQPRPNDLLSIQHVGSTLVAKLLNETLSLFVTKVPSELQFQSWILLHNGRLKNIEYNKCLSINMANGTSIRFQSCENETAGVWEFRQDLGAIVEQNLKQCLSVQDGNVTITEFSASNIAENQKFEFYSNAEKVSSESTVSSSASNIAKTATTFAISLFAAYFML
jgi:hypothetical protein